MILDDDHGGVFQLDKNELEISEAKIAMELTIRRFYKSFYKQDLFVTSFYKYKLSIVGKTNSGTSNNTYLNNFDILNKV